MVSSPLHQYITDNYVVTHNTSAALFIAQKLKQRTLILCHKLDLIDQFRDEANRAFDNKLKIGEYHGKKKTQGEQITIASFQTLARLDEKERVKFIDGYSLVVIDEAHVSAAQMFSLVNQSKARYKLGLTATPERNDGLTHLLFCFFGQPCYQSNKRAKNMDILPAEVVYRNINATVLPIVRRTAWGYKLSYYATSRRITLKKETTKEGYVSSQEEFIYDVPHAKRPKVDAFKIDDLFLKQAWETITDDVLSEYEKGHSCLVMFKQKKHVDLFAETLSDYEDDNGNNVEYVKYYGDNADCASALKKAREQRRLITIATYSKVTEGTDCKQWECAFVASSIGNGKSTEQAVGRIRRSCDTPKLDKVKIYDYRAKDVYTYTTQARKRDERYAELGFTVKRGA
jgi:superfamily II DNA or RNA helicase